VHPGNIGDVGPVMASA